MSYKITFDPKAQDFLRKLNNKLSKRIIEKIKRLEEDPRHFAKPLSGIDLWVLRIGDYRILFDIDFKYKKIEIVFIGHRKSIYENL